MIEGGSSEGDRNGRHYRRAHRQHAFERRMSAAVSSINVRIAASAASPSPAAIPSRIAPWSGSARRLDVGDEVVR